jgi:hypothetical protein
MPRLVRFMLLMVCLGLAAATASAQSSNVSVADFYKDKNLEIVVGYTPGGGYDLAARVLSRHIGKYIPGEPKVIVRNMPGAGTVLAANHVNNVAPKDGTTMGIYADLMPVAKLLDVPGVQFDPAKFGWIGSITSRGTPMLILRKDAPATTFDGIRKTEVLIGASGPDATSSYAHLINDLLDTKLKVLAGYTGGTAQIDLAIQRGEVHGRASAEWERLKLLKEWTDLVVPVLQMSTRRAIDPNYKDVPLAPEQAKNEEDRQIMELVLGTNQFFRAFSTPPGVPADRLAALRVAFEKTMKDEDFIKEFLAAAPGGMDVSTWQDIDAYMMHISKFPPNVIKRAAKYVSF